MRTWDDWYNRHQPFELDWWRRAVAEGHSTSDFEFNRFWDEIKAFIEPRGRVIDIGCGPRPPFAPCAVIEPLAHEYKALPQVDAKWWEGVEVHAVPAEFLLDIEGGDTIVCWNCLDHAIGWQKILDNMLRYGKPGASFALSTDFCQPFLGHPGFPKEEFEAEIAKRFSIIRRRDGGGGIWRQTAMVMRAK